MYSCLLAGPQQVDPAFLVIYVDSQQLLSRPHCRAIDGCK